MAPMTKLRTTLPITTKVKILLEVDKKERSKMEIAREFNLSSSSFSTILKNREKIMKAHKDGVKGNRQHLRNAKWPALETALVQWIKKMQAKNVPIDGKVIKAQTDTFALRMGLGDIQVSDGWIQKFQKRHALAFRKVCGESASVDLTVRDKWTNGRLQELLKKYAPEDIYNADEAGLMFKLLPDRSYVFVKEKASGGKTAKDRITVLLAANMTGKDKLPILVIGKSRKPRCFKGVRSLPVIYKNNRNSWMTAEIFESWVRDLDRTMALKNRKILLIVDNCPAHHPIENLVSVELEFLPPNMTSVLQPLDQGVIACVKRSYRRKLLQRIILCLESDITYNVNLLSALHFLRGSWDDLPSETIAACFRHAGFTLRLPSDQTSEANVHNMEETDNDLVDKLRRTNLQVPEGLTFEEFAGVDNSIDCVREKSDEEIVDDVLRQSNCTSEELSSDDETDVERPCPTIKQAVEAVSVLRNFFHRMDNSEKCHEKLSELESFIFLNAKSKQALITEFFK